jgi:hypothetical protein
VTIFARPRQIRARTPKELYHDYVDARIGTLAGKAVGFEKVIVIKVRLM